MLNKLKIQITIINLSLMYLIFLLIFVGTHKITSYSIENREDSLMKSIAEREVSHEDGPGMKPMRLPPNILLIKLDDKNQVVDTSRDSILSYDEVQRLTAELMGRKEDKGSISVNPFKFQYYKIQSVNNRIIVLSERSQESEFFNNLLFSFAVMGLLSGVFAFIISIYFAERAIRPIRESIEKQKTFVEDASHELRTPLAVINSNLEIVLDSDEYKMSVHKKWLDNIHYEVDAMSKLIVRLLMLAKTEANGKDFSEVNLSSILSEALLPFDAVISDKGLKLTKQIEPDIMMNCDEVYIKQMVNIFMDNGIKYTSNGEIFVGLKMENKKIKLTITDTGIGIGEADTQKVFERFYKADKSRNRNEGSMGLGLAIASNIINMHNGTVSVESKKDAGTKFTILF
ncbi:MAG TPA: hypothetical protein DEP72_04055 [Clostridiales bacterium]|nr:MAG: hypothetical protein A2Y18_04340 [Clostridiales bacterium GWD2_32_19]HCC07317.1 hypothetical protein [Clostridiales bacterium]